MHLANVSELSVESLSRGKKERKRANSSMAGAKFGCRQRGTRDEKRNLGR